MMQRRRKMLGWARWPLQFLILASLAAAALPAGAVLKHHKAADPESEPVRPASTASQAPAFSIPVEPLGFYPPGPFYLGQRESLASLDFLDEGRLLFTFRTPGLLHRSTTDEGEMRQIRAQVIGLPKGTVETEALWTLQGHDRYLWMLQGGQFLLRDGDLLKQGDATLELKPLLEFPGPLVWLGMDPEQHYLVTNSDEPAEAKPESGQVPSPATAAAKVTADNSAAGAPNLVLRILKRDSGQVMLVSRVRTEVHLSINGEGFMEVLRADEGRDWLLDLNFFTGGSKALGHVSSTCEPPTQFVTATVLLANTCLAEGGRDLVAYTTEGKRLWHAPSAATQVWPLLMSSPDGSLLARETLTLDAPLDGFAHTLSTESIKGQLVEVIDTKTGELRLKAPASPVFDAGGNVALSPSGRRVAILNGGAIDVYDLAAPQTAPAQHTP